MSTNAMMSPRIFFSRRLTGVAVAVCLGVAASSSVGSAADATPLNAGEVVEWFAAEEAGQIEIKFIPQDATAANIIVRNLTDQPLQIRLPEAFAAVPILAQGMGGGMGGMGGGGMGGGGMGGGGMGGGGGGGQGMGGGMGGGGMGGGGMGGGGMGGGGMGGGGGGMFRIAPEAARKTKVTTVCLEHGKPDPNPKMAYKMIPAAQFTNDARVLAVCKMLGYGQITQNTAQAATWHLTDNLSWQQLSAKNRVESKYTGNIPFFSPFELRQASAVVAEATTQTLRNSGATSDPYYDGN